MLTVLLVLLPGFPFLLLVIGGAAALAGHSGTGFRIVLWLYNLYLSVPASVFGGGLFPSEEFGHVPTLAGNLVAFGFYAILAIALSVVVGRATGTVGDSTEAGGDPAATGSC